MDRSIRRSIISGKLRAPSSAPAAHRAILAASLADGQSVLSNIPFSSDIDSTISACRLLGADIVAEGDVADIIGATELSFPSQINCAESNTTLKLLMPLASLSEKTVEFSGGVSLSRQALVPFIGYLDRLGATCEAPSGALPLKTKGPISEHQLVYFPQLGTQFLSGILLSSPLRDQDIEIGIDGAFASREHIDCTLEIMKQCRISFDSSDNDYFRIEGLQSYFPLVDYEMPASAFLSSFLLLAGAIAGKVSLEKTQKNPILETLLSQFGATAKFGENSVSCSAGALTGVPLDALSLGVYLPHALVLASFASGTTEISNIAVLKKRQANRMRLILRELSKMGAKSEEKEGKLIINGSKLSGAALQPEGDATAAMVLAIAALGAGGPSTLSGAECVEKSYAGFFRDLASLGAIIR